MKIRLLLFWLLYYIIILYNTKVHLSAHNNIVLDVVLNIHWININNNNYISKLI